MVIYPCKRFEADTALAFTRQFFDVIEFETMFASPIASFCKETIEVTSLALIMK